MLTNMKLGFTKLVSTLVLGITSLMACDSGASESVPLSAKWIWKNQNDYNVYNQTIIARKRFKLDKPATAQIKITADSYYRLWINGQWINDGPCRSWPEHFQYDVIDASPYLKDGANDLMVVARYYGVGDFHKVPLQAGLLAQLDVTLKNGKTKTIGTDSSWEIAESKAWMQDTPKISIQMEPFETYDARLEDDLKFSKAKELYAADKGPWKGLNARDVALLTRQPFAFKTFGGAKVVKCEGLDFCLPAVRLMNPGVIEANHYASGACGMAAVLETTEGCTLNLQLEGTKLAINGQPVANKPVKLAAGKHLLLAFVRTVTGHDKEKSVRFMNPQGFKLVNPLDAKQENPWCLMRLKEYNFVTNDLVHNRFANDQPEINAKVEAYQKITDQWLKEIKTLEDFTAKLGGFFFK